MTNLSKQEIEILRLMVEGFKDLEIANVMTVNIHNIELRIENILRKLQAKSKTEAVINAIKKSLI